jgi:hypothetical protein
MNGDFRLWHFSEVAALMRDVRCWEKSGSRILGS